MLIVGLSGIMIVALGAWAFLAWPIINAVETGRTPEYADLRPQRYLATKACVFDAAMHTVNRLPRWQMVGYREDAGEIRAEVRTRLWRFVDDVTIRVTADNAQTLVSVKSASRVGRGDFGQNARNIRTFLGELNGRLGLASDCH